VGVPGEPSTGREGGRRREQEGAARRREGAGEGAACRRGEQGRRTRESGEREDADGGKKISDLWARLLVVGIEWRYRE